MSNKLAVVYGGPSPEHDISILTGLQAAKILSSKHEVLNIYWSRDNKWFLVDNDLESNDFLENKNIFKKELTIKYDSYPGFYLKKKKINIDLIVNSCHGGPGEDGTLQSLFTLLGINFTGPSLTTSQLCMDKYTFFALMKSNNIPVLERHLVSGKDIPDFEGPYILKPRFGGSSIGVEIVEDYKTAITMSSRSDLYKQGATIEKYLDESSDLLIAVRSFPNKKYSDIEKPIRSNNFEMFSYSDKYLNNGGLEGSKRELPAKISKELEDEIYRILDMFMSIVDVRGIARVDFLLKDEELYLNEVNTIPGSHALYLWESKGFSKYELMNDMISEARNSLLSWTSEGSDGTALKSAKDIKSKLG
tara:strand:- start:248 stop:1330 length:1083 start_codon:yes stop_codon:yes gene_type:complete